MIILISIELIIAVVIALYGVIQHVQRVKANPKATKYRLLTGDGELEDITESDY